MKYTYYSKVQLEEHLYYAEELYGFFAPMLPKGTMPKDIHPIIRRYIKDNKVEVEPLYYQTKSGLKRVYSSELALSAIEYHVSRLA